MAEKILGPQGSKRRSRFRFLPLPLLLIAVVALILAGSAGAVHDLSFQLDGNVAADPATHIGTGTQSVDWASLFNANGTNKAFPAGFTAAHFSRDFGTNPGCSFDPASTGTYCTADSTTFATGSKDTLDITPGWMCTFSNNVNSKTDLSNVYAATYTDPTSGHKILYFGLERNDNSGDGNIAFWFLQGNASCQGTISGNNVPWTQGPGGAAAHHTNGDLLLVSSFTKGGTNPTVTVYEWYGDGNTGLGLGSDATHPNPIAQGADCKINTTGGDVACATVNGPGTPDNGAFITTPWLTANKTDGTSNKLYVSEFYEGGLDLTAKGLGNACFSTFLGDTRSSQSLTATIFDFASGSLQHCGANITINPNGVNEVNTPHTFTVHITTTNAGVPANAPDGTHATVTLKDQNNNTITPTSDTCQASGAGTVNGNCTVTVNSTTAKVITANASTSFTFNGATLSATTDGVAPNSGPAVKRYVDANVSIAPSGVNEVNHAHTFTITSVASPSGTTATITSLTPSVSPSTTLLNNSCGSPTQSGNTATCSFSINSSTAQTFTANATAVWGFADADANASPSSATVTRSTSGNSGPGGSGAATKVFEDASITIGPSATNEVGAPHTFTLTFKVNRGDGNGFLAEPGASCTITLTNSNGAAANPAGPVTGTTNASGQLSATFTSATAGQVTGNASCSKLVNTVTLTRDTDPATANIGSGPGGSGPATKTFENASITIGPSATNEVGAPHTFTLTFKVDRGDGNGLVAEPGASCTITLTNSNGAAANPAGPVTGTTNASGQLSATFTSATAGQVTGNASCSKLVNTVTLTRDTDPATANIGSGPGGSGPATKTFVDAYITIAPHEATNNVGQSHTFVISVFQNDGLTAAQGGDGVSGFAPAPDHTAVTVTFQNDATSNWVTTINSCASPNGTTAGTCNFTGSSNTAGTVTVHADVSFLVGGQTLHRATGSGLNQSCAANATDPLTCGDGIKHFVAGSVSWEKDDNAGHPLGGATFLLCRTNDFDVSAGIMGPPLQNPVCYTVADNGTLDDSTHKPDTNPADGLFTVGGLPLGRYTAVETIAPLGWDKDPTTQTVDMTPGNIDVSFANHFVNLRPILKITGFGYTNAPSGPFQPTGIFVGTTTYTLNLHNYGSSTAHLTHSNLTVSGNATCTGGNLLDLSGTDIAAGADLPSTTLTCTYDHPSPTAITATLTVDYTTNGFEYRASGSPATITFTVDPNNP